MLTVAKITRSAAVGYAEYLDGKAQASQLGDYYLKDGERTETPGRWAQGAQLFGLDPEQPVTGEQLRTLMDVRRPDDGEELRRVGATGEAVAALDATFSAPKSVSAVWALAAPELRERVEHAHETAVDRALTHAVRQVPMLRRRVSQDTVIHEKATGVVATSWRHTTARAVDQQVPDPQLHSHVLLHAAVRRDGKVVAIDSRSWLVHQREVRAAYRTELARELSALGFAVRRGTGRGRRYFELDAIPQPLLDRWSSRHHQVQAAIRDRLTHQHRTLEAIINEGGPGAGDAARQLKLLQQTGQLSPKQDRLTVTATRSAKTPVTVADLDGAWRRTALGLGASRERIDVLRHQPHPTPLLAATPGDVLAALTEFDATFPARDARAVALERSAGAPIHAALEQLRDLRADDEILVLADRTGTTRAHRGRERTVVAITQRLTDTHVTPIPAAATARETDRLDHELAEAGGRLSDEQRTAIQLACGTRPLVVIEGQAGTGKSTTLTGIARAHQACGREILVTSTGALAAQRLATDLEDHDVQCQAFSTAALHAAITHNRVQLTPNTTIIHDEAALASTREQLDLLQAIESSGARLIALGDPRQNQPVGAGGLWSRIEDATQQAGAHVELTRNQRARDPADRRDQALFRDGHAELAIRGYAARDRVHLHPDQQRAEDQALDAAHLDRSAGTTVIVIAQTSNEHLDALNARAQAIRKQAGQLGDDSLPTPGRPYQLHAGDHVQIRHTTHHPDHGPLRNGTTAQITAVHPRTRALKLELADGSQLELDEPQATDADLRLAYVQHPFPAQGQTTDTTHLIIGPHATREGSYVALTRARDQTHIYAATSPEPTAGHDRLQDLAERISHTEPDLPSIQTPLAHGTAITTDIAQTNIPTPTAASLPALTTNRGTELEQATVPSDTDTITSTERPPTREAPNTLERARDEPDPKPDINPEPVPDTGITIGDQRPPRIWPATKSAEPVSPAHVDERDYNRGWEPWRTRETARPEASFPRNPGLSRTLRFADSGAPGRACRICLLPMQSRSTPTPLTLASGRREPTAPTSEMSPIRSRRAPVSGDQSARWRACRHRGPHGYLSRRARRYLPAHVPVVQYVRRSVLGPSSGVAAWRRGSRSGERLLVGLGYLRRHRHARPCGRDRLARVAHAEAGRRQPRRRAGAMATSDLAGPDRSGGVRRHNRINGVRGPKRWSRSSVRPERTAPFRSSSSWSVQLKRRRLDDRCTCSG
jgi:conjugative relaxase-like TrwC/TraI family protein